MLDQIEATIVELRAEGNGSVRFLPLSGGRELRLSYLWGKLRVEFVDLDGKISLPERRVGERAITDTP